MKENPCNRPILALAGFFVFAGQFILESDISNLATAIVLSQVVLGQQERPIARASRMLNRSERNYCTACKEILTVDKQKHR